MVVVVVIVAAKIEVALAACSPVGGCKRSLSCPGSLCIANRESRRLADTRFASNSLSVHILHLPSVIPQALKRLQEFGPFLPWVRLQ